MSLCFRYSCATLLLLVSSKPLLASSNPCKDLSSVTLANMRITSAELIAPGTKPKDDPTRAALTGSALSTAALPGFCLVRGNLEARTGVNSLPYEIRFELRLPDKWIGRFLYQGGGGMDGVVNEAIGAIPTSGSTATPALDRGYAVVSTDSGHQARSNADSSFGVDQQARVDYAYAAIGKVTAAAKLLILSYYKRTPDHSYFMGCSNGGREAMIAAERFPTEFDGIVAGNPGFRLSHASIGQMWDTKAFLQAAPKNEAGDPILANALTPADLTLVSHAILDRCGALDGAKDGSIDAMQECRFDPVELQCTDAKTAGCLSAPKVQALKTVFAGAHDSKGHPLYSSWPWDAGIDSAAWRSWKLGTSQTAAANALNVTITSSVGLYFMTPPDPAANAQTINFDTIADQVAETGALNDATSTLLSTLVHRGGKLLVFEGNSDPVFSANDLRAWWQDLAVANGGADRLARNARLFLVPGMNHCGGGPALDDFDPLTLVELWVEKGEAPMGMLARGKSFPGRSRQLCPVPQEAHYEGIGDVNAEASFVCKVPAF